ncbi:MAG: diphosphomevalonate decarboxylase [Candidatus Micrarchaeota archaeon]
METTKSTAIANSNIAVIKYWGKRDDKLNLPTNNSISFTMDDQLQTITTVEFDESLRQDELKLNDHHATSKETERVSSFLDIVRKMAKTRTCAKVVSKNSFPKSAGLASSASGFAALAGAASRAAGLNLSLRELSILARYGSGSASRSIFGGAVEWLAGKKKNGSDSYSVQLSPSEKWTHLRNVIAVVSESEKKISSVEGMRRLKSSSLFKSRLESVGKRLNTVRNAIKFGKFEDAAIPIMQDSDNMHAVMLDCWPPVRYLTDISFEIIEKVLELNESHGKTIAAYTFDAGPNAHVYTTEKYAHEVERMLKYTDGVLRTLNCRIGNGIQFTDRGLF